MRYAWGLLFALILLPVFATADTCPSLSLGSTGTSVTAVQKILYAAYANFPSPTGTFDVTTQTAIKQWQSEHGISQTGTIGPLTAAAMKLCVATPTTVTTTKPSAPVATDPVSGTRTLSRGLSGTDVTSLQQFLISQKLLSADSATGFFGALTEAAVKSFQRSKGIVSAGTPSTTGYGAVGPKTRGVIASTAGTTSVPTPVVTGPTITGTGTTISGGTTTGGGGGGGGGGTTSSCAFNGGTIPQGASVTAYQYSSVATGQSCASQSRTCSAGTLSGTYQYSSCTIGVAQSCTLNGTTVASGASQSFYSAQSVASGLLCSSVSQSRTCTNGVLSGDQSYQYSSCVVGQPTSCVFNGSAIISGGTVTAYQAASVAAGQTCVSQTRSCSNGTLSGSYQYASCTVAASSGPVSVALTVNDKEGATTLASGGAYTVKWSSTNAISCSASTYSVNGGTAVPWTITPNISVTYPTTLAVNSISYTISCTGASGSAATKTVTVTEQTLTSGIYDKDGYLIIPAKSIFPSKFSILPSGVTYTDTVPDTLDLAFRAAQFLHSEVTTSISSLYNAPAHAIFGGFVPGEGESTQGQGTFTGTWCKNTFPCLWPDVGDWGLEMIAMTRAREMTAYDRDDAAGSLSGQYTMLTNLYDISAQKVVDAYTGAGLLRPQKITPTDTAYGTVPESPITGSTFAMEALMAYLPDQPGNTLLQTAVQAYIQMHKDYLSTSRTGGGTFSYFYNVPLDNWAGGEQGVTPIYPVFVQGRAAYGLLTAYQLTGNATALSIGNSLMNFLQNWIAPYSGKTVLPSSGTFTDHIYSEEQGLSALITDAEIHKQAGDTATANAEFAQADRIFQYIITATNAGIIGDFGESGTSGEMIRDAIRLTDNGIGSYYDKAEYWTRNQLAEEQLGVSSQIGWNTAIGGMFWSDATHPFSIPTNNKNYRYNVDGSANAMIAMSDVWSHIVTTKGSVAYVNFLLNGTSKYVTVRSDLPYRGQIEAQTAQSLDSINALAVRIPDWTDHTYAAVSITARDAQGERTLTGGTELGWLFNGAYAYIYSAKPNTVYTVHFPIKIYTATVYQMRPPETFWYESSVPSSSGPAVATTYTGTFRGYELVSATPAPNYAGIALYQRQALAALPAGDVAPPTKTVQRFIHNGTSSSIPTTIVSPTVSITVNAQASITLAHQGDGYTVAWNSSNVSGTCTLSYVPGWGESSPGGSSSVGANVSGTLANTYIGTYTYTCPTANGNVSKTATVSLPTTAAVALLNADGKTALTLAQGSVYTLSWSSANVASCNLSWTPGAGNTAAGGSAPIDQNTSGSSSGGWIGSYTFACTGADGSAVSRTVTITR
ncbi:MAG: hypothetical protein JWM46_28 [Candidatus Kaiserbacteria bacterium]|nr:hypothetical protein [Candidatus Kaiserbacteria bacterium]